MNTHLFSPTHLKALCAKYNLRPSKKYGQNYLVSKKPIDAMIEAGELSKKDTVIEIGPGFGVLTLPMAPLVKHIFAFEIERTLMPYWEEVTEGQKKIEVIWGNALHHLEEKTHGLKGSYKVLANLPYQITSHALRTLLELTHKPERIIVMVQKEVAERMCAAPGDMNVLALSVQYYGRPKIVTKVPKGSFWPSPKVDSAVIAITHIASPSTGYSDDQFFAFVKAGFANKRKQLWRNISTNMNLDADRVKKAIDQVAKNEKIRAEELSLEAWKEIVSILL